MALTKRQEITLYSVLQVPYSTTVFRLQDVDNLLVLAISVGNTDRVAHIQIQSRLTALGVPAMADVMTDLQTQLDAWYDLFGDSTQMDGGGVGATTGVSFNLAEERKMIRERILAMVPFSKDYMANEMSKTQSGKLGVVAIR